MKVSPLRLLHSEALLKVAQKLSDETPGLGLSDAFFSLQSMLLPILTVLTAKIPEADLYHSAVTGYGGLLGAMAAIETNKPFVLTEHGIYPREREEELISSDWTVPSMRPRWISLFYEMSKFAYKYASRVTSLFEDAKARQIIIGCDSSKCVVVPNGIMVDKFNLIEPQSMRIDIIVDAENAYCRVFGNNCFIEKPIRTISADNKSIKPYYSKRTIRKYSNRLKNTYGLNEEQIKRIDIIVYASLREYDDALWTDKRIESYKAESYVQIMANAYEMLLGEQEEEFLIRTKRLRKLALAKANIEIGRASCRERV